MSLDDHCTILHSDLLMLWWCRVVYSVVPSGVMLSGVVLSGVV